MRFQTEPHSEEKTLHLSQTYKEKHAFHEQHSYLTLKNIENQKCLIKLLASVKSCGMSSPTALDSVVRPPILLAVQHLWQERKPMFR